MAANTITKRVEEFLVRFPPFDRGTAEDLQEISSAIVIRYLEAGEMVFTEGEAAKDFFYVVRQGSVEIVQQENNELVDICDEGDIFGVRPLLAQENYLASAKAQEECLLYAIPIEVGRTILNRNAKVALFFAMGYASGKPMQRAHITEEQSKADQKVYRKSLRLQDVNEVTSPNYAKEVLTCSPTVNIKDAATKMSAKGVGSIVVVENDMPIGIVTDNDLRSKVATGKLALDLPVSGLMSSPVKTVAPNISVAECMIQMVNFGVHHLCVTKDGTPNSALEGIISDHDLLLVQGNNPAILIKEIKKSSAISEMVLLRNRVDELTKKYLDQEVSIRFVRRMTNAVNDALYKRLIDLAIAEKGEPPCSFCWINLGSAGREEQLLRTDQDHALIFEEEGHQDYFLELAQNVSSQFEHLGFEQDAADIGANHHKWCQPLETWKTYFNTWVHQPDEDNILLSNIFFDFRPVYGQAELAEELGKHLYKELATEQLFLPVLAKNALANPAPLSFFRNILVEKSGEHKNDFDLKLRAMLPLTDAARVFCLHHEITGVNNTAERFISIADREENNQSLFKEAAHSFEILMRLRGKFGFKNGDSGRYIQIKELDKLERQTLRNIFSIVNELQKIMEVRFQLNYLG